MFSPFGIIVEFIKEFEGASKHNLVYNLHEVFKKIYEVQIINLNRD